jgi:hypothetical protein
LYAPFSVHFPVQPDVVIVINQSSTFKDVLGEITKLKPGQWSMLQANYGPWPYWTVADLNSTIAVTCRTLYAVNIGGGVKYLLAVLRTLQADFPLAICKRVRLYTLRFILMIRSVNPPRNVTSQVIRAADPNLGKKMRLTKHPNGSEGARTIETKPPPDIFPTKFFVIADEEEGTYHTQ